MQGTPRSYRVIGSALLLALVLGLYSCRSARGATWSFPCTGPYLKSLEQGFSAESAPSAGRDSSGFRGGVEELPVLAVIVFLPVLVDFVILPVTLIHDIFWS